MFFILVLFLGIGAVMFGLLQRARQRDAWKSAALALGLAITTDGGLTGGSQMGGSLGDVRADVYTESRGSGDNRHVWTIYRITFGTAGPDVTLTRAGAMSRIKRAVGFDDVLIGDGRFDDSVDIRSATVQDAVDFLSPTRRAAILSLFEMFPRAEVNGSRIEVASRGAERSHDRLISNVRKLAEMARLISDPQLVDHALTLEADGNLGEAADALAAANVADPNLYTQLLEAEARVALGQRHRACDMLTKLEERLPADPEVNGWHRIANQAQTPQAIPEVMTAEPPPALRATDLTESAVVADLFARNRPSYEVEEHFSNAYRGAVVTWTGTVQKLREFQSDRDFGDTPGQKVTITVGSLGDGRLVSDQIDAIVQLPADAAIERDQQITFTGTLHRVDRFMRNIYVSEATLV